MRVISVLLVLFALGGCDKDTKPAPVKPDKQSLSSAKDLALKGDLEGAHQKIAEIAVDSPERQAREVLEIEDRWAEARIDSSNAEKDATKQIALLRDVANASIVRPDLRNKAANRIALLEAEPKPPDLLAHADPKLAEANLAKCRQLLGEKKMKEARDLLYPRVTGGIGTVEERDMLLAICALAQDKECLAKLEELGLATKEIKDESMKAAKAAPSSSACFTAPAH